MSTKIRVYQAPVEYKNKFMSYEFAQCHGGVDTSCYKCVYDGEVPVANLEALYMLLNTWCPEGYTGHSLSVSDIVVLDDKAYFVDDVGFIELTDFEEDN